MVYVFCAFSRTEMQFIKKEKKKKRLKIKQSKLKFICLFKLCGISTFVGYLMPNPFL